MAILSAWAGKHDPRFTMANYVHVNDEDLSAGAVALLGLARHEQLKIDNSMRSCEKKGRQKNEGPNLTETGP